MTLSGLRQYNIVDRIINKCGTLGGVRIAKGNISTQRNPVPLPICPPQIPPVLI
jgi:hypothetical protein